MVCVLSIVAFSASSAARCAEAPRWIAQACALRTKFAPQLPTCDSAKPGFSPKRARPASAPVNPKPPSCYHRTAHNISQPLKPT